jgi:hypothetical protein
MEIPLNDVSPVCSGSKVGGQKLEKNTKKKNHPSMTFVLVIIIDTIHILFFE